MLRLCRRATPSISIPRKTLEVGQGITFCHLRINPHHPQPQVECDEAIGHMQQLRPPKELLASGLPNETIILLKRNGDMDKSNQMPEDRPRLGILTVTEHHQVDAPAGLGLDNKCTSPVQAHELRGGGRLMLLSVFEILNHPRISGD